MIVNSQNNRKDLISTLKNGLNSLPEGSLLDMNSFKILELFFDEANELYFQTVVDSFFTKIDMSSFVRENNSKINMLLGANLSRGNIDFKDVVNLFFNPKVYSMNNLKRVDFFTKFTRIPSINLTNNNFRGHEWNLDNFLSHIFAWLKPYIESKYYEDLAEEADLVLIDDAYIRNLDLSIELVMKNMIHKLIPILKNTGLRISYRPKFGNSILMINVFESILRSGKFDGCYLDVNVSSHDGEIVITSDQPFYYEEYFNSKVVGGVIELKRVPNSKSEE